MIAVDALLEPLPGHIEGIVFDLDGVLIQSRAAHAQAFHEVLSTFGITDFEYDRFAGWRTPEVFRAMFAEHAMPVDEETIVECARRKSWRARELVAGGNSLTPGCLAVLQRLSRQYRMALASSGSRASVEAFLDRAGMRALFQVVLSGDDIARAKPDPEIFSRSFEALGIRPENCLVIEDAVAGVQAARSAGSRAIGFANEHPQRLVDAGAVRAVSSLDELEQLLDCGNP